MTEQEQKAFDQMREALENIAGDKWPDPEITAEEYAREALAAANAVSHAKPETTPAPEGVAITVESGKAMQPQFMGFDVVVDPTMKPNEMKLVQPQAQVDESVYCFVYEWDTPFGLHRSTTYERWNGNLPDRSVPVYAHPQATEPQAQVEELVREIHQAIKRGRSTEDHGLMGNLRCILDHVLPDPDAHTQATEPAGWKLVPVEPTDAMLEAALNEVLRIASELDDEASHSEIYQAMLAAAPEAP